MAKKKELSFGEMLQRTVDKHNKRTQKNRELYAAACLAQGKKVGEPVDIMSLLMGKRKE